jgi:hypothetical protein
MISQAELKELLTYDSETGVFTRNKDMSRTFKKGQVAGCIHKANGDMNWEYNGKKYKMHRLAWLYVYGEDVYLDHVNGNRSDNRIANLRPCTHAQNMGNKKVYKNNKSGYPGVKITKDRFRADIRIKGVNHYLGTYSDAETAYNVYKQKHQEIYGNVWSRTVSNLAPESTNSPQYLSKEDCQYRRLASRLRNAINNNNLWKIPGMAKYKKLPELEAYENWLKVFENHPMLKYVQLT